MKTNARPPQAPESYATFWEPIAVDAPVPAAHSAPAPIADSANDAYLEFVNVTEAVPLPTRPERV
jgi:hypothetical protein